MAQPHTGPISSVPALQEASRLSLVIVNASQKTKHHKVVFHRLANDVSEFVDDMIDFYLIMEPYFPHGVPEELAVVFQRTVNSLKYLQAFTRNVASRNFFTALLFYRSDARKMKAHDQTLAMTKGLFKMIGNVYVKSLATEFSAETVEALIQRFQSP